MVGSRVGLDDKEKGGKTLLPLPGVEIRIVHSVTWSVYHLHCPTSGKTLKTLHVKALSSLQPTFTEGQWVIAWE